MPAWERDVTFTTSQEWPPPSLSWQLTDAKTLLLLLLIIITVVTIALVNLCLWLLKAGESLENFQALGCVGIFSITGISYHLQSHLRRQMSKLSEQNYGGKCGFVKLLPNISPRLIMPCKLECKLEWNILMVDDRDCYWIVCHFRNGQWNLPSTGAHAFIIQKIFFTASLTLFPSSLSSFPSPLICHSPAYLCTESLVFLTCLLSFAFLLFLFLMFTTALCLKKATNYRVVYS